MKNQIVTMLSLQNEMNAKVHPNWREQGYEWYRAIWIEAAELMDHYGWKWWKKQSPDRDQVILELVDIWHFGLSDLLQNTILDYDRLANEISKELVVSEGGQSFLADVERFAAATLQNKSFAIKEFVTLMNGMDLSFIELYRTYVGKNVLNFFRQDNGYKSGEYIKVWQGKEDNEHLVEIVQSLDASSESFKEDVYAGLLTRYPVAVV